MAAKALMFTCLTGSRTSEVLQMKWSELDFDTGLWNCPSERMKGGEQHRVPLTGEMLAIVEPLKAMASDYVFEGQKRHRPLSNMAMLMLLAPNEGRRASQFMVLGRLSACGRQRQQTRAMTLRR